MRLGRRPFLAGLLATAAGSGLPGRLAAAGAMIRMMSSPDGADVWFDPVGLWVPPGTAVTWSNGPDQANTHTATAYHPANDRHALRIPGGAAPWDSGYILPGAGFTVTLTEEGVYDYYCRPHEMAGMVGRIVVGRPGGPPPAPRPGELSVPDEALRAFPPVERILDEKVVRR